MNAELSKSQFSPLRPRMPAKDGIRIVESGELRVVNKAAKQHWDFTKNPTHLKKHLYDLRFEPEKTQFGATTSDKFGNTTAAILVKTGLSNLNTPSLENLEYNFPIEARRASHPGQPHQLRDAPPNRLGPVAARIGSVVGSEFNKTDSNFHTTGFKDY